MKYSVRRQNGCWNCKRVFVWWRYRDPEKLYCTKGVPRRPLCMSAAMREIPIPTGKRGADLRRWIAARQRWDKWVEGRARHPADKCEAWKEKA